MNIFEDKSEMPGPNSSLSASATNLRTEFYPAPRLPGEMRDKDLSVKNIEPRKRGCHY